MTTSSAPKVAVYLRDKGIVCFVLPLFFDSANGRLLEQRITQILTIGLDWYWTSDRTDPVAEGSPVKDLPSPRRLTQLTENTVPEVLSDFDERNVDGYGRHIAILGLDSGSAVDSLLHEPRIRALLTNFAKEESGPIRILIFQENDGCDNQIYVPHAPPPSVQHLMESWGILPNGIGWWHRRKYSRLGVVRLENLIAGIAAMAMGTPWNQQSVSMK